MISGLITKRKRVANQKKTRMIDDFNNMITEAVLGDAGLKWQNITWCNNRVSHDKVRERIDKGFNKVLIETYPDMIIFH